MFRSIARSVAALAAAAAIAVPAAAQEADTVNKSLVRVIAVKDGKPVMTGTGFAIGNRGFVVTADHVTSAGDPKVLKVGEDMSKARPAKIVFTSKDKNFSIIEVANLGAPGLTLAAAAPKQGQAVYLFGFPGADSPSSTLTNGMVSSVMARPADGGQAQFVQHTASGGPGTGGGPLVNACGGVLGVHGFLLQGGAGLALAASKIAAAAKTNKVAFTAAKACNK